MFTSSKIPLGRIVNKIISALDVLVGGVGVLADLELGGRGTPSLDRGTPSSPVNRHILVKILPSPSFGCGR